MLRAGFVLEQTLGHVTYSQNMRRLLANETGLDTRYLDVPFQPTGKIYRLPPLATNWTLRGGLFARNHVIRDPWVRLDVAFIHTLTIALLATPLYRRVPTVISLDATPKNLDSLAAGYKHHTQPKFIERFKLKLVQRALALGKGYVAWSTWAKDSLVLDYGVPPDRVLVIAPGTNLDLFRRCDGREQGPPRILFVGGDFFRKGGDLLLDAYRKRLKGRAVLDIVSSYQGTDEEGVCFYGSLPSNSPELVRLYQNADVFALPTRADCLAVVLGEAMAASLPIVTTTVGGQAEAIVDGQTGFVVAPNDVEELANALEKLVSDPKLRREMGEQGRSCAEARYDARKNALQVVELMRSVATAN